MKTLEYDPVESEYRGVIITSTIVRLSKSNDGETSFIHLNNGEVIETNDSINTLEARLNSKD